MHRTRVKVAEDALDANETIARANRDDFDRERVAVVNLMGTPGAGKTALLEAALANLDEVRAGVLEGDVQGSMDADRIAALHVPVVQLNTEAGFGGECHLDANMVRSAIPELGLGEIDLLVIENVGNLVCPAEFRVGEDARVMVCSVTEGEDKPLKYPLMFRACELVLVNKIDLLPHLEFDLERFLANLDAVHPAVEWIATSALDRRGDRRLAVVARRGPRPRIGHRLARWRSARRSLRRRCSPGSRSCSSAARRRIGPSSRPRPSGWRAAATRWPNASLPAGGCSRSAPVPRPARTPATSRSSSCIR